LCNNNEAYCLQPVGKQENYNATAVLYAVLLERLRVHFLGRFVDGWIRPLVHCRYSNSIQYSDLSTYVYPKNSRSEGARRFEQNEVTWCCRNQHEYSATATNTLYCTRKLTLMTLHITSKY